MSHNKKVILGLILLGFFVSGLVWAQDSEPGLEVKYPTIPGVPPLPEKPLLPEFIRYLYYFSIIIAGLVAFASLIYGGFRYLTSVGQPVAMADARDQISAGIVGLIILLGSYLLLTTINPQLAIFRLEKPLLTFTPECGNDKCEIGETIANCPEDCPVATFTATTDYLEVPIGTLIERVLDKNRLNTIQTATENIKNLSNIVKEKAEDLAAALRQCQCGNLAPACGAGCTNGSCQGDPCPNRQQINQLREELRRATDDLEKEIKTGPLLPAITELNKEATKLQLAKLLLTETLYPINYDNFLELEQVTTEYGGKSRVAPFEAMGQVVKPKGDDAATFYLDYETNKFIIEKIMAIVLPRSQGGAPGGGGIIPPGFLTCRLGEGECAPQNFIDEFGQYAWEASVICQAESGGNPCAINPTGGAIPGEGINPSWLANPSCPTCDYSVGLFQLNLLAHCPGGFGYSCPRGGPYRCWANNETAAQNCLTEFGYCNSEKNAQKAKEIWLANAGWCPWSTACPQYCNICRNPGPGQCSF
jgi:hypothetical protein